MTSRTEAARPAGGVRASARAIELSALGPLLAGYALPFVLVLYLGLEGGGYDLVVRSEVGIAAWWIVLLGALVGVLPHGRITPAGWVGLSLLVLFAAWTALGISWSESSERSVAEVGRVGALLGIFVLALCAQGREGLRRMVSAAAAAIALLGVLALLSRLHPSWFPAIATPESLSGTENRLSYPLNYWNGVAALAAIGVLLSLGVATSAKAIVARALSAAVIPALVLAGFFTLSRGGALELAVGLVALFSLHPRRMALLGSAIPSAVGSAILVAAATQRDALLNTPFAESATSQGDEMIAMVLVVCAGVGLLVGALGLARRHDLTPALGVPRRAVIALTSVAGVAAIAVALATGLPGELSDRWEEFKAPVGPESNYTAERFASAGGNGRYQYWQSALEANATDPLTGIGPGTFEYWWAREGNLPGFVRDAHSLYLETLGELGIIGLFLIGGAIFFVIGTGAARSLRGASPERRALLAAATAACTAFAVAAAVDWAWELTVLPVLFLLLAAAILGPSAEPRTGRTRSRFAWRTPTAVRTGLCGLSALGLVAIAIPMAGTASVRDSQAAVRDNDLAPALEQAQSAAEIQPYAATPSLQQALVLELDGDFDAAAKAAQTATSEEPTNWRTWLVLSRIEAQRGNAEAAVAAYREARSLNPRSPLFAR